MSVRQHMSEGRNAASLAVITYAQSNFMFHLREEVEVLVCDLSDVRLVPGLS